MGARGESHASNTPARRGSGGRRGRPGPELLANTAARLPGGWLAQATCLARACLCLSALQPAPGAPAATTRADADSRACSLTLTSTVGWHASRSLLSAAPGGVAVLGSVNRAPMGPQTRGTTDQGPAMQSYTGTLSTAWPAGPGRGLKGARGADGQLRGQHKSRARAGGAQNNNRPFSARLGTQPAP